jgi:ABC-type proline/glycine betaine transport system substrate-binding protein
VAPAESEGLAYIVEARSGKIILSQSITKTNRTIFFGAWDPEIQALIKSALGDAQVKDPEYQLYYSEAKK